MTLTSAEKNIGELIESTKLEYNQRRQNVITSELIAAANNDAKAFAVQERNRIEKEAEGAR